MDEGSEPLEGELQYLSQDISDDAMPDSQANNKLISEIEQGDEEAEEDLNFENAQGPEQGSRHKSRHEHSSRHKGHKRRSHRYSRRHHEDAMEDLIEEDDESEFPGCAGTKMTHSIEENDMEDGEILEDGEIATDEDDDANAKFSVPENDAASAGDSEDHGNESESEENKTKEKSKRDRRKKPKKEKRHKDGKQKKKSRRHAAYVDHDRLDYESGGRWSGYQGGLAEEDENYDTHYQGSSHYARKRHAPRDSYYYVGSSPPGLYDSPSEESDDEVPSVQQSMTSMVSDEYVDANVAANEKEPAKVKGNAKPREKRKTRLGKRKGDIMRHIEQQPKKKPLLEIPMAERPICKFFKEGKCAKGSSCPFNHDFKPKRLEVCKFYTTQNGCQKGENCIYMHGDYPCKYYHTGATCYSGDNCRFSHDPLTEDTRRIVEEMRHHKDFEMEPPERHIKKPSLLGSPPRHIKEAAERAKEVKKIPSLFDIEVFPPGKEPPIPTGFYSERSPRGEKSPPPERKSNLNSESNQCPVGMNSPPHPGQMPMSSQGFSPNQGPISSLGSHQPGPSLLGSPAQGTGMVLPMRNNTQQGPMMMAGPNGPSGSRPMMGQQRPMFGMQQGMNPAMHQGMNPAMHQGMNPGMQRLQNPGMQNMNPGMQQGPRPGMQQGLMQVMNSNLQQGLNQVMKPGMQQGIIQNMPQNMNLNMQSMNQPINTNMQQGMNPGMQQGMNPGMQQGINQSLNSNMQQGINPNMPQNMNSNMQQGINMPSIRGMNPGLQQGMNANMQHGMPQGIGTGMLNPRIPGGPRLPFNLGGGQQTASSMPPVLNMISALLRGASGNGPFSQNSHQQQLQQAGVGVSQDTDMRRGAGGQDVHKMESPSHGNSQDSATVEDSVSGEHEDGVCKTKQDSDVVPESSCQPEQKVSGQITPLESQLEEEIAENQLSDDKEEKEEGRVTFAPDESSQQSPGESDSSSEDQFLSKSIGDRENESAIPMHLPPMQRQLFMRIRQQQLHQLQQPDVEELSEGTTKKNTLSSHEEKHAETMDDDDDDNWYSSDEEDQDKPKAKLTDILKTITQTSGSSTVTTESHSNSGPDSTLGTSTFSSTASTFNVMQMIQSIRNQAQTDKSVSLPTSQSSSAAGSAVTPSNTAVSGAPSQRDPRQRQTDPRLKRSAGQEAQVMPSSGQLPLLPPLHVDPPVTNAVPHSPMTYQISLLILPGSKVYASLPSTIDPSDPLQKADPRVQRFLKLQEEKAVEIKKPQDPRLRRSNSLAEGGSSPSSRPQDPRSRRKDPRMQGMMQDPRPQPVGPQTVSGPDLHLQNVPPQEPWLQNNMGANMMHHHMGPGGMMQQQNNMGPGPEFQNGMMPGPRMMQNDPRNSMMGMPGGLTNMQQGTMGMQQGPMGMQQRPMGMQQGPMGMQQGPMGMQQRPMGMQQGLINMQQGPLNMQQGPMGFGQDTRQGNLGMQQGPLGMQQGPLAMQHDSRQSSVGMLQGPMGGLQGNMGVQHGSVGMQQGPIGPMGGLQGNMGQEPHHVSVAISQDPRQNPASNSLDSPSRAGDPRLKRGPQGDPRQVKQPLLPVPGSGLDPRMARLGVGGQRQGLNSSPRADDSGSSPSHPTDQAYPRNSFVHSRKSSSPSPQSSAEDSEIHKAVVTLKSDSTTLLESGQHSVTSGQMDLMPKSEAEGGVSDESSNSEDGTTGKNKKTFDHRNDPRFKRKPAAEKCVTSERTKKFIGQRKSSMEYSSPLGGGDDGNTNTESGYNSYNRPPQGPGRPNLRDRTNTSVVAPDVSRLEPSVTSSQQHPSTDAVASPELLPPEPEPLELKDLFRTIDPTASPFC